MHDCFTVIAIEEMAVKSISAPKYQKVPKPSLILELKHALGTCYVA